MQSKKIESSRLESYKLDKRLNEVIKVASDYIQKINEAYARRGETKKDPVLHLYARDYREINDLIEAQSGKAFDIKSVTLNGWRLARK